MCVCVCVRAHARVCACLRVCVYIHMGVQTVPTRVGSEPQIKKARK